MALSPKRRRFVAEYLKDQNATQAAIRAGYSEKTAYSQGPRLLENVEIKAAIEAGLQKVEAKALVTAEYVLGSLKEIAERCMQRQPVMTKDGKDWVQAHGPDGEGIWEFDSTGANGALKMLGTYLKLFSDRLEVSGGVSIDNLADLIRQASKERGLKP